MCGRVASSGAINELADRVRARRVRHAARYRVSHNIAPTSHVAVVRTVDKEREVLPMRWGVIPHEATSIKQV